MDAEQVGAASPVAAVVVARVLRVQTLQRLRDTRVRDAHDHVVTWKTPSPNARGRPWHRARVGLPIARSHVPPSMGTELLQSWHICP